MNILDIIIAKKKSFTGETESLVRRANEAMEAANEVATTANAAAEALAAAQEANETAQSVASNLESLQEDIAAATDAIVDDKIASALNNLEKPISSVVIEDNNSASYKSKRAKITKNNIDTTYDITKNYTSSGSNEDGSMTQKAITDALNNQKTYLENKINKIPTSGGNGGGNISGNIANAEKGSVVIVGQNGNIEASDINENDLIKTQIVLGTYATKTALGVEIDYENKTVIRLQEAVGLSAGSDFDKYPMYGGRKRCLVADDGEILAFYGDENYTEDGSLGQIMVYQPKFYYLRAPLKTTKEEDRTIINKEIIYISSIKQSGFSIHPLFCDENNEELDYVLLSAYNSCAFDISNNTYNLNDSQNVDFANDLLSSIAGAKPISGTSQAFNVVNAEQLANNRGAGWHLTNLAAESLNQMLMIIEFGSLNLQNTFNKGITQLTDNNSVNISCITGSTSTLNGTSGMAASTSDGNTTYELEGKCAINYRGVENPYGNIWHFVGNTKIVKQNGKQYVVYKNNQNIEKTFACAITNTSSWISHFGYDENATWAFIPAKCQNANSAVPVGDYAYINNLTNEDKCCVVGGKASSGDYSGPFYYGMDYAYNTFAHSYSGRIMYIPTAGTNIYLNNISKWESEVGGE